MRVKIILVKTTWHVFEILSKTGMSVELGTLIENSQNLFQYITLGKVIHKKTNVRYQLWSLQLIYPVNNQICVYMALKLFMSELKMLFPTQLTNHSCEWIGSKKK
jgi:hypothetical protein